MGYEKQEGAGIWLPDKEDEELEGEVTHINREGLYGVQYTIKKGDNDEVLTPSHKVLQNRMQKAEVGTKVKIVFKGTEPPKIRGQNPTSMYEVYFDK
ncbi:hypothetical protein CMI37_37225 [Candidatus Pacearchaeota archaeon]|nr:hypothetical protein [Candidatus Pacearchaeota archaeon]|tara:strand:+ start:2418 stop:2708 length:291 start_codon:yes stop_codon:yes gene_type:complete